MSKSILAVFFVILFGYQSSLFSYKVTPIVRIENEVITENDLKSRIALMLFITQQENTVDNYEKIKPHALQALIDELLYIKEAKEKLGKYGKIDDNDVEEYIERIAEQNGMNAKEFLDMIAKESTQDATLYLVQSFKQQIKGQIARIRISENFPVQVSDIEVEKIQQDLACRNEKTLYDLSEIVLPIKNDKTRQEVKKTAQDLVEKIQKGSSFYLLAQQYSKASSSSQGGNLGRLGLSQMDTDLKKLAPSMKQQDVRLIEKNNEIRIIRLNTIIDQNTPNQERASIKIASLPITQEISDLERIAIQSKIDQLKNVNDVATFLSLCRDFDFSVQHADDIIIEQVQPEEFKNMLKSSQKNTVLPEIANETGIQIIYVVDKGIKEFKPLSQKEIKMMLTNKKRQEMTQMYFNKLKGRVLIEYCS